MNSNIQLQWIWWYWLVLEFFCKLIETLAIAWSSDLLAFVWALMIRSVRVWWRTGFKSRLDESHNRQRLSLDLSIFGEFPWLTSDTLHRPCVWIISVAWKEILTIRIAKDFPHHGLPFSFLPSPMHRFLYLPVWAIFCHLFIYLIYDGPLQTQFFPPGLLLGGIHQRESFDYSSTVAYLCISGSFCH